MNHGDDDNTSSLVLLPHNIEYIHTPQIAKINTGHAAPAVLARLIVEETDIMCTMRTHPNVLPLVAVSRGTDGVPVIVTPFMSEYDLFRFAKSKR